MYFPKVEEMCTYTLFIIPSSRSSPDLFWFPGIGDEKERKNIYNRQMKMTVYEDRLDQARKDNKGDDKKEGKIARRKTLFITFHTHVVR